MLPRWCRATNAKGGGALLKREGGPAHERALKYDNDSDRTRKVNTR